MAYEVEAQHYQSLASIFLPVNPSVRPWYLPQLQYSHKVLKSKWPQYRQIFLELENDMRLVTQLQMHELTLASFTPFKIPNG